MTASLAASHDELVERADSLEQAERHKSELISMVSHEVRTPLASILGFTRLLLERDLDEADRRRYLGIVDAEATRLAALVSDFLDARLIEEGQFALRPELFDVRSLVLEQAELALGHDNSHELELQLHDTPLYVAGRPLATHPGRRERALQRGQVLADRRHDHRRSDAQRRRGADLGGRRGHRHRPRAPRADLRALLPRRRPRGRHPGHGARARRLSPDRRGSRRDDRVRLAGRRHPVLDRAARRAARSTRESRTSSASRRSTSGADQTGESFMVGKRRLTPAEEGAASSNLSPPGGRALVSYRPDARPS